MKLYSWNVNGIRSCVKKGFMDWALSSEADLICLQETRLSPGTEPKELQQLEAAGYSAGWNHADKKGYSGTATWSRLPATHQAGFGHERFSSEGRTVVTELGDLLVVNGYFPNGGRGPERLAYKLDYYADLLAWCALQRGRGKSIVITGDLNTSHEEIDLARPKANRKNSGFMDIERAWITRFIDAGFVDSFRIFQPEGGHYSWWSNRGGARERNVGWRLDYFLVSEDLADKVKAASIHADVMGSDHCPISVEIDL